MANSYPYRIGLLLLGWLLSASVYASASDIQITDAWTRATAPGQDAAGIDMTLTSKQAAMLVGVSSPAAKATELHSMKRDNGMMRMREVKFIALPAGKSVNLKESGYHLMLNGLKASLKEGDAVPLTLSFKVGKQLMKLETKAEVRSLHSTGGASQSDEHHHNH